MTLNLPDGSKMLHPPFFHLRAFSPGIAPEDERQCLSVTRHVISGFCNDLAQARPEFNSMRAVTKRTSRRSAGKLVEEPPFTDISDSDWAYYVKAGTNREAGQSFNDLGVRLTLASDYKPRKTNKGEVRSSYSMFDLLFCAHEGDYSPKNSVNCNPSHRYHLLYDLGVVTEVARAMIEAFKPEHVTAAFRSYPQKQDGSTLPMIYHPWLLWLPDAVSLTDEELPTDRTLPATSVPWMGGVLHTWPDNNPDRLWADWP